MKFVILCSISIGMIFDALKVRGTGSKLWCMIRYADVYNKITKGPLWPLLPRCSPQEYLTPKLDDLEESTEEGVAAKRPRLLSSPSREGLTRN